MMRAVSVAFYQAMSRPVALKIGTAPLESNVGVEPTRPWCRIRSSRSQPCHTRNPCPYGFASHVCSDGVGSRDDWLLDCLMARLLDCSDDAGRLDDCLLMDGVAA
eukprot:953929-Prymnesium_polylepis.1